MCLRHELHDHHTQKHSDECIIHDECINGKLTSNHSAKNGTDDPCPIIGGVIGSQFPINTLIMNYALIAMFLCMMVMQFVSKAHIVAAIASVGFTVILTVVLQHNIALVIATILASCIGYIVENRTGRRKGGNSHA